MKLIEALVLAQREYGIYGNWQAIHNNGSFIGLSPYGHMYLAYDTVENLISQSERLETVISHYAQRYPYQIQDEKWTASRWEKWQ